MKILTLAAFLSVTLAFRFTEKTNTVSNTEQYITFEKEKGIDWKNISLADAKKLSKETGKPIYMDISAVWCGYCKKMKKNVYRTSKVIAEMNRKYIALAIDGEKGEGVSLVKKHKIKGYPTQLIIDTTGNIIKRNDGYMTEKKLLAFIN